MLCGRRREGMGGSRVLWEMKEGLCCVGEERCHEILVFCSSVGNGICDEYHVIRHCMNLETVNTYEGMCVLTHSGIPVRCG